MDYRHLTAFLAVAESLNFSRAAERLHVAQPALSQQIRQLERALGVQLFERDTRRVRLTSAGHAILASAEAAVESLMTVRQAALAGGQGQVGRISIGFAGASSHAILPRLARRVREEHPGLMLTLVEQVAANAALSQVIDGTLDIGFVRMPINAPGIATRVLAVEDLIVGVPLDHPFAKQESVEISQLSQEPFVLPVGIGSSVREAILQECTKAGFAPQIAQEATDSYTIMALVAAGVGVTMTLSSVAEHIKTDAIAFLPINGKPRKLFPALAWRENNTSPALRAVLDVVERDFGEVDLSGGGITSSSS
jgi:DNA-binding transcriptional LysR family regulator